MEYCIGLVLGLVLGLSGAGGSVFGVPLIILFLNRPVNEAIVTALGAVMLSALYGTFIYRKDIQLMPALVLGISGMLSAPLGRIIGSGLPNQVLLIGFCLVSIGVAWVMWTKSRVATQSLSTNPRSTTIFPFFALSPARQLNQFRTIMMLSVSGVLIGFVSGLFGLGWGVLLIPFITYLYTTSMRVALATSFLSIVLISMSGFSTILFVFGSSTPKRSGSVTFFKKIVSRVGLI